MLKKLISTLIGLTLGLIFFAIGLLAIAVLVTYPKLPNLESVTNYQPKMPLLIYSSDEKLIGMYGEERRNFTQIDEFPESLKNAVIAAEDQRFYEHWGVDVVGVARAMVGNLTGGVRSGASTITQQVARNFYLTNEQTLKRKFNEALLAYKIEQNLSKDQILELYFNQIYLGQRSYGFAAASYAYYNKPVEKLSIAEAAMLAGLPKAPSAFNPIVNYERAKQRQHYILRNMQELGMITAAQRDEAMAEKLVFERAVANIDENSLYVAEMARQAMVDKYGEEAYTQGFRVYTTASTAHQEVATKALRTALENFDRGARFHGPEAQIDLSELDQSSDEAYLDDLEQVLSPFHTVRGERPAVVTKIQGNNKVTVYIAGHGLADISGANLSLIKSVLNNSKAKAREVTPGSLIRVSKNKDAWRVVQQPELQGALVALDVRTGAVRALVGGYDFHRRTFNRATQAWRQPGSTFKPFIYSAALAKGVTAATSLNDAPLSLPGMGSGGKAWEPKNSDGRYAGYISMRQALVASKNVVTVRLLMMLGIKNTKDYLQRFGFADKDHPSSLSMALGSGSATPLQMAEGYAVFANGGYKVTAYVIDKVYDGSGRLRAQTQPLVAGQNATQAIDPRNAYIMTSILRDVTRRGTAARANSMGRTDIAGKTGTTNDMKDAWFVGYNPKIVTAVYVGFDQPRSLGRAGYGGVIALPVWMDYMRFALKGMPNEDMKMPKGMVQRGGEYFYEEQQSTNTKLNIDNRSSAPIKPEERDTDINSNGGGVTVDPINGLGQPGGGTTVEPIQSGAGPQEVKPINTAPAQNSGQAGSTRPQHNTPAQSQNVDELF
ncbi:penicillin-binding protein 1A [Vitreoscilla sp. C1]|uniref:penicillin-binding protein 1A n=1 Tax=Vitreoscilla sp. (strain C1) TaxID=96942 RepID=UPI003FCE54FB